MTNRDVCSGFQFRAFVQVVLDKPIDQPARRTSICIIPPASFTAEVGYGGSPALVPRTPVTLEATDDGRWAFEVSVACDKSADVDPRASISAEVGLDRELANVDCELAEILEVRPGSDASVVRARWLVRPEALQPR